MIRTHLFLLLVGCSGTNSECQSADCSEPSAQNTSWQQDSRVYSFESRFSPQQSSVSTSGQVFRQVLIADLSSHMGGLTERINSGFFPIEGEVFEELNFYFDFDSSTSGGVRHQRSGSLPIEQEMYDDLSTGKNLIDKVAGNDPIGQHINWQEDGVVGFSGPTTSPERLVLRWFEQIDDNAVAWSNGHQGTAINGELLSSVYLTKEGLDLKELTEKFLLGAVCFSQAADDYLDDDEPGKGLLSPHSEAEEGETYSSLEHAWDEGFGYFGASRSYGGWTLQEVADAGAVDANNNGSLDVLSEFSFGASVNAAKRDLGAVSPTSFKDDAFSAFYEGRLLLASTDGELSDQEMSALVSHRDDALSAWEKAISATVVHYINEVIVDMAEGASLADHAKHWSEMKGFALAMQFNPHSALTPAEFAELHELLGDAPNLKNQGQVSTAQSTERLLQARALLGSACLFSPENLGDEEGHNGW